MVKANNMVNVHNSCLFVLKWSKVNVNCEFNCATSIIAYDNKYTLRKWFKYLKTWITRFEYVGIFVIWNSNNCSFI